MVEMYFLPESSNCKMPVNENCPRCGSKYAWRSVIGCDVYSCGSHTRPTGAIIEAPRCKEIQEKGKVMSIDEKRKSLVKLFVENNIVANGHEIASAARAAKIIKNLKDACEAAGGNPGLVDDKISVLEFASICGLNHIDVEAKYISEIKKPLIPFPEDGCGLGPRCECGETTKININGCYQCGCCGSVK